MKNKISKNYFLNVSYQLFSLLVPLFVTPYVSRVLGVEQIGIYSYTYSNMRYFWILSILGIGTFGVKIIGQYSDNKYELSKAFFNVQLFKTIISSLLITLYFIFATFLFENTKLYYIESLYLFSVMLDISWFFQGIEKYGVITIKNFLIKILSVICIFLFVKKESDFNLYVFFLSIFAFAGNLFLWPSLIGKIEKVHLSDIKPFSKIYTIPIIQLFFPTIASQIFAILDKSFIGWITHSNYENGIYEQAFKIIEMCIMIISALSIVKIPSITRFYKNQEDKKIKETMNDSYNFVLFIGLPILFGLFAISSIFVPIFFGDGYDGAVYLIYVLSSLIIFTGMQQTIGNQFMIPTENQQRYSIYLLIGGIVNIVLNIIFIYLCGALGASISSAISEMLIMILCIDFARKKNVFNVKNFIKIAVKYLISSIIMFVLITVLIYFLNIDDSLKLIIAIFSGIITYLVTLLLLHDNYFLSFLNKVKKKKG